MQIHKGSDHREAASSEGGGLFESSSLSSHNSSMSQSRDKISIPWQRPQKVPWRPPQNTSIPGEKEQMLSTPSDCSSKISLMAPLRIADNQYQLCRLIPTSANGLQAHDVETQTAQCQATHTRTHGWYRHFLHVPEKPPEKKIGH